MNNKLVFNDYGVAKYQKKENGQTIDVEVYDISVKMGPGFWTTLHCIAFYARTKEEQLSAVKTIKLLCHKFPCQECRHHAKKYIKDHPMEKYVGVKTKNGDMLGLFTWTWKFHNAVNHRIDKPILSWEMAYEMYKNIDKDGEEGSSGQCSHCSSSEGHHKKKYTYEKNDKEPYFLMEAKNRKKEHKSKHK